MLCLLAIVAQAFAQKTTQSTKQTDSTTRTESTAKESAKESTKESTKDSKPEPKAKPQPTAEANPELECATKWRKLDTGLDYRAIRCLGETDGLDMHVVRVDPQEFKLNTAIAERSTARAIASSKDAPFAVNTNFFDKARQPLGLIVRSGEVVRDAKESTWQSIFLVDEDNRPRIILPESWEKYSNRTVAAVQAGPRLVIDSHVSGANNNYRAERVGVCIQTDGDLIFFATPRDRKLHVRETARIAQRGERDGGLACRDAMLFDGGHSVNFFVEGAGEEVSVSNGRVPVFLYATER